MNKDIIEIKDEIDILEKQLNKENNNIVTNMILYIRSSNIKEYDMEIIIRDLYNIVLDAQDRNDNIENVIGSDYKVFCDNIILEANVRSKKQSILYNISILTNSLWILLIFFCGSGLNDNYSKYNNLDNILFTNGALLSMTSIIVGGFLLVYVITKFAFLNKIIRYIILAILFSLLFYITVFVGRTLNTEIFRVNTILFILIFIGLFILNKTIEKKIV